MTEQDRRLTIVILASIVIGSIALWGAHMVAISAITWMVGYLTIGIVTIGFGMYQLIFSVAKQKGARDDKP